MILTVEEMAALRRAISAVGEGDELLDEEEVNRGVEWAAEIMLAVDILDLVLDGRMRGRWPKDEEPTFTVRANALSMKPGSS